MENGRDRKISESVARFSLAGCTSARGIGEKKRNVNVFSLLYSFSHFSSSSLSSFSRYTLVFSRILLSSLKFLIPALLRSSIFITLASLTSVFFPFFSTPELLVFLLLEALLLTHACILFFIFYSCLLPHSVFSYPFCLLISISSILILIYYY